MKHLKLLRESRGLSQQKLAELFCLSQQSIYKYENGLAEPDFATLKKLSNFFHTSIDYLISDEDGSDKIDLVISATPKDAMEAHHLEMYRRLSERSKKTLDDFIESFVDNDNYYE